MTRNGPVHHRGPREWDCDEIMEGTSPADRRRRRRRSSIRSRSRSRIPPIQPIPSFDDFLRELDYGSGSDSDYSF
jgi:hypothetical protein